MTARFLAALALAALSCQVLAPGGRAAMPPPGAPGAAPQRVQLRSFDHRPPLVLIGRLGDPFAAAAVAAAHDGGSEASAALLALIEARVAAQGFRATRARAHGLGFELASLVGAPDQARRFIEAASAALRAPVQPGEPALQTVGQRIQRLRGRAFQGGAQAAVAACTGELAAPSGKDAWDPTSAAGAQRIEAWRRLVDSSRAVAFAALGEPGVLDEAAGALEATPDWPERPEPADPWPERDIVGAAGVSDARRQLSLALRVGHAPAAREAAGLLGRPESALALRLRSLAAPWSLDRVVFTGRPRGACLRIDVTAPSGDPAPTASEVARTALVTLEEAELALAASQAATPSDDAVLQPSDPREAASVAAWRALSSRLEPGATRKLVSYEAEPGPAIAGMSGLARALEREAAAWKVRTIEPRARIEPGQGELWALLASPCGTVAETRHDAGLGALVVRTIATRRARVGDVILEPWTHPDGMGLLAHAPRRTAAETPAAHAERVGAALGRALAGTRLDGTDLAAARAKLLEELGPGPEPGFWLAIDAAAPGHPSWLEARGSWTAISEATLHAAEARRLALARGPLRLAVLANSDQTQVDAAIRGADRWLRPLRSPGERCPATRLPQPQAGELKVETTGEAAPSAFVAVPLSTLGAAPAAAAEWTVFLLNRPGGWLDQAVRLPGVARARAKLVGGSRARALIVEVSALDVEPRAAVAQVRALLERLAAGAATARDVEVAAKSFAALDTAQALEPRRRIVELWHGTAGASRPTLAELRAFHQALRPERHAVVLVESR